VTIPDEPGGARNTVIKAARTQAVAALKALDAGDDADFRRVMRLAARLFEAPAAAINLIDGDRLWPFATHGAAQGDSARVRTLTSAIVDVVDSAPLAVLDAASDPRFAGKPSDVAPAGDARFLAGAPIVVHGQKLGALCVSSPEPRHDLEDGLLDELVGLGSLCGSLFELKDEAHVRARMAAELIKEEWRHALTLEAGKVGSWVWDFKTGEIVANDIFRQMFGLPGLGPLTAEAFLAAIDRADIEGVNRALEETFENGADYNVEFRVAETGRWLVGRGRVYQRDGAGRPLIMMGVDIDVTDAREAAEQQRVLLRELNHRVKNTLAMIQSLARQTLRQKPEPGPFIESFSGRLRTLSEAHALLAESGWSGIALRQLIQNEVGALVVMDQLLLSGDEIELPPDHAVGLGLVLHELTSNALKFGALSAPAGRVNLSWAIIDGPPRRLDLAWREEGGPAVNSPRSRGFGTTLIERSLDKVLDSSVQLSFPREGVRASISLPIG